MQLISTNRLKSFQVIGNDGKLGKLDGFLFNSKTWKVKYLKVKHGFWLFGRELLIPVEKLASLDRKYKLITTELTKNEIAHLMSSMSQQAQDQNSANNMAAKWIPGTAHPSLSWANPFTRIPLRKKEKKQSKEMGNQNTDALLFRSFEEIEGYRVNAIDGKVGNAKDFILDIDTWTVSYIIVKGTGKKIMLPSQWVSHIQPVYESLVLNQNKNLVLTSPYAIG